MAAWSEELITTAQTGKSATVTVGERGKSWVRNVAMNLLQSLALGAAKQLDVDVTQRISVDGVIAQRLAKESFGAMAERDT